MKDRFKFRVWDNNKNKYLDNGYIHRMGYLVMPTMKNDYSLAEAEGDFSVEQCTGLKDKNENLIYENDYIENDNTKDDVYLVVFDEKTARFMAKEMNGNLRLINKNVRVVGNIHENKYLLEG